MSLVGSFPDPKDQTHDPLHWKHEESLTTREVPSISRFIKSGFTFLSEAHMSLATPVFLSS